MTIIDRPGAGADANPGDVHAERTIVELPARAEVMAALTEARLRQRQAEIDQIALVATAADAYGWINTDPGEWGEAPSVLHGERLVALGSEGTPEVAEFITHEVGPALRMSPDAARCLIRDVLNLRHRLPQVWAAALDDRVEVRIARTLARTTAPLGLDACRWVDDQLAGMLWGTSPWKLIQHAEGLVLRADAELAEQRRREQLERRHVTIGQARSDDGPLPGVAAVFGHLDVADALRLDGTLEALAQRLDGDASTEGLSRGDAWQDSDLVDELGRPVRLRKLGHDERRARALGLLADPLAAAQLLAQAPLPLSATVPNADSTDPQARVGTDRVVPQVGKQSTAHTVQTVNLVVRLGRGDLGRTGGEWGRFGPQTRAALEELLAHAGTATVRVQPVIDLNEPIAVRTYRPSPRLAAAVRLRDGREIFPWSNRRAADSLTADGLDLDHTTPWPTGPTALDNLGLLSRTTHRAVTHGGFTVEQVTNGVFRWTTPTGQTVWTTPQGTSTDPPPQVRRGPDRGGPDTGDPPGATTPVVFHGVDPASEAEREADRLIRLFDPPLTLGRSASTRSAIERGWRVAEQVHRDSPPPRGGQPGEPEPTVEPPPF